LGEGTPFWCFIAFLLTSFAKILEGGYTIIPPSPPSPPPPLCASMGLTVYLLIKKVILTNKYVIGIVCFSHESIFCVQSKKSLENNLIHNCHVYFTKAIDVNFVGFQNQNWIFFPHGSKFQKESK
jgi:hypothetical protein